MLGGMISIPLELRTRSWWKGLLIGLIPASSLTGWGLGAGLRWRDAGSGAKPPDLRFSCSALTPGAFHGEGGSRAKREGLITRCPVRVKS